MGSLTSYEKIDDNSEELEKYGLDNPRAVMTIQSSDGTEQTLSIGDSTTSGEGIYALKAGDEAAYLLSAYKGDYFLKTLDSLRDRELPDLDFQNLQRITLQGERLIDIVPYFPYAPLASNLSPLLMIKPFKRPQPINTQRFAEAMEQLTPNLKILSFVPEDSGLQTGLNQSHYSLYCQDNQEKELKVIFGNETDDGQGRYARIEGIVGDVILPAEVTQILSIPALDLSDRFVELVSIDLIRELRVTTPTDTWTASISEQTEDTQEYRFQGELIEEDPFKKMYQKLLYLFFEGEIPQGSPVSVDKSLFSIEYIGKAEEDGSTRADFYNYDTDFYAVSIDRSPPEFLVGKYQVEDLIQYLKTFDP
jgi:hypothetical protein